MKARAIAIHSSRGGTGKTVVATNLAAILASRGYNVALLDLDFRAPSLYAIFSKATKKRAIRCWLNDFLNGACNAEQALIDVSEIYNLKGKLLIGLANPSIGAVRNVMDRSRSWEVSAVKKLFSLLSSLFDKMKVDCCIFDTSPGVQFSSINAVISSDISVTLTTLDSLDLDSTGKMLSDLYDALEKKTFVLVNKFSPQAQGKPVEIREEIVKRVEKMLKHPVIGVIPCYCDVLQTQRSSLLTVDKPDHPFVKDLEEVATKLEQDV